LIGSKHSLDKRRLKLALAQFVTMGNVHVITSLLSLLCLGSCLNSCKQDPPTPLQVVRFLPKPYLPVYPGSHWNYRNELGDTVRHYTSPEYEDVKIGEAPKSYIAHAPRMLATKPHPLMGYIYGYTEEPFSYKFLVSETLGDLWADTSYCPEAKCTYWRSISRYEVTAKEDSVWVNGVLFLDVIVVRVQGISSSGSYDGIHYDKFNYYARDVGLIKMTAQGQVDFGESMEILDYNINE